MFNVIRFRLAMLLCLISHALFPLCQFKGELTNILFQQRKHFNSKYVLSGMNLKQQIEEEQCRIQNLK